jgi:PAS domain-containing protein
LCSSCGFGLVLETLTELAPSPADAFLVVDDDLNIQAISHQAEELLGVSERSVVQRPLTDLLVPADADHRAGTRLVTAVSQAASGVAGALPAQLLLRPAKTQGMRLNARVGRCGPPLAALIVLEPTDADRIHLALSD